MCLQFNRSHCILYVSLLGMMAQGTPQGHQERTFHFENVSIFKDEDSQLGVGSYGAVYKAKCDQLPCVAKILHPVLFQTNDPGSQRILERFMQECGFLSSIRHPNIVQYLGVCQDRDSRLPVLLMELLDSSLTKFLETSNKPLPYHVQVDLCFDVAVAIAYLHSNGIIHRDLSGNNVLIAAGSRAKVTDFGMSQLVDACSRNSCRTLTQCPGTEVYMPPEALRQRPVYTKMLDCFSFGVVLIQMLTRLYPNPGPRSTEIPSPLSPTGVIEVPVIDAERRKEQIDKIDPTHPLLPVATECLKYDQEDRPPGQQLCEQLATLKEGPQYLESKQHVQESSSPVRNDTTNKDRMIQELQQQVVEKDQVIQEKDQVIQERDQVIQEMDHVIQQRDHVILVKDQKIHEKDQVIQEMDHVIQEYDHIIQRKDQVIQTKNHEIQNVISEKERILHDLNRQLQNSKQVVTEFLAPREKENRDLQENLSARDSDNNDLQRPLQHLNVEHPQAKVGSKMAEKSSIKLRWRDGRRARVKMAFGSCVMIDDVAYFKDSVTEKIFTHNASTGKWDNLPNCPHTHFTLVAVNRLLTSVGGKLSVNDFTDKLLSLVGKGKHMKWEERLPGMPTKRKSVVAVCSGKTLVVVGGESEKGELLKVVELLDTDSLQWFTAKGPEDPLHCATAAVCGDNLYLVGGYSGLWHDPTNSVVTCSLSILVKAIKPGTLGGWLMKAFSQTTYRQVWHEVASLPVVHSTCASFDGQLIAVGGKGSDDKPTNSVYAYDPTTNHWNVISTMPTARHNPLVAVLPGNQVMVVGGFPGPSETDKVEIGTF